MYKTFFIYCHHVIMVSYHSFHFQIQLEAFTILAMILLLAFLSHSNAMPKSLLFHNLYFGSFVLQDFVRLASINPLCSALALRSICKTTISTLK